MNCSFTAFGGSKSARGNTGPFWIASGLSLISAFLTILLVKPLTHDGMKAEDEAVRLLLAHYFLLFTLNDEMISCSVIVLLQFRLYLEQNGFDVSSMGTPKHDVTSITLDVENLDGK